MGINFIIFLFARLRFKIGFQCVFEPKRGSLDFDFYILEIALIVAHKSGPTRTGRLKVIVLNRAIRR